MWICVLQKENISHITAADSLHWTVAHTVKWNTVELTKKVTTQDAGITP